MKNFFLIIIFLFLSLNPLNAEPLKANLSFDEFVKGFFGIWYVTSEIESASNYSMFNRTSKDIWNLSGNSDVLILENGLTGATSSIKATVEPDKLNGQKLKFTRVKEFQEGKFKFKHIESPEFILEGNTFKGYDTFTVEKYDLKNNLISVDVVKYKVLGQKIAGE